MTPAEWRGLIRPYLDERWGVKGRLAYVRPTDSQHALRGVLAERSSGSGFYIWQVRLPLYGPSRKVLGLNWSDRVGGGSRTYTTTDPDTDLAVRNAVDRALIEAALEEVLLEPPGGADNGLMQEVRGYGLLLLGDARGAVECLGRVEREPSEIGAEWERQLRDRAGMMKALIEAGGSASVIDQMRQWRAETLVNLGLGSA